MKKDVELVELSVCYFNGKEVLNGIVFVDIAKYVRFVVDYCGDSRWRLSGIYLLEYWGFEKEDLLDNCYYCNTDSVASFVVRTNTYFFKDILFCSVSEFTNSRNNVGYYSELMRLLSKVRSLELVELRKHSIRCYKKNGEEYFSTIDVTRIRDISRADEIIDNNYVKAHIRFFGGRWLVRYIDLWAYEVLLQLWYNYRRNNEFTEVELPW